MKTSSNEDIKAIVEMIYKKAEASLAPDAFERQFARCIEDLRTALDGVGPRPKGSTRSPERGAEELLVEVLNTVRHLDARNEHVNSHLSEIQAAVYDLRSAAVHGPRDQFLIPDAPHIPIRPTEHADRKTWVKYLHNLLAAAEKAPEGSNAAKYLQKELMSAEDRFLELWAREQTGQKPDHSDDEETGSES
jgi:hypothetical protein